MRYRLKIYAVLAVLAATFLLHAGAAGAATSNQTCNATIQATGACSVGNNGVAGVLFGYWASLTDAAPADPNIASDAIDLRDAICANFRISTCTSAAADGAVRRYLEELVKAYRQAKQIQALSAPTSPTLDGQQNP